ncbi:MAG: adenylate/guanylate cyclase domain-containing protein [Solirubrobacteraceae bacterium]
MAESIPGSRLVVLEGDEHLPWLGDAEAGCREIEHFVTGIRPKRVEPGVVRAILQCDIEGSTLLVRRLRDERWADLLREYGQLADLAVSNFGGRIVDRSGDGLMAVFEGPVNAVRAAEQLQFSVEKLGLKVRAGVHIGEVLEEDGLLRGVAVHVSARVMAMAAGGEIFASETVKDIVAGSALQFEDRGAHELKGIEGPRRLYLVTNKP